jgi:hypothetical protein
MRHKLLQWAKMNYWAALGFGFCVVLPVYLLNEVAALSKVGAGVKLTFMGCIAVAVLFIATYKRLKLRVYTAKNLTVRESLLSVMRGIWWGIGFGIIYGLSKFADKLESYWWKVGICFLAGSACYLIHSLKKERERKLAEIEKENALTERIAAKLKGGQNG